MNIAPIDYTSPIYRIQIVALRKPMLQRTRLRIKYWRCGTIQGPKFSGRSTTMRTLTAIINSVNQTLTMHGCIEIGQAEERTSKSYRNGISGVQAEEIDAGEALHAHIGTYI